MPIIQPRPKPVDIDDLRPTQMCVGFAEVARKVRKWDERDDDKRADILGRQLIEVVAGPVIGGGRRAAKRERDLYIIDNHHHTRALWEAGQTQVLVIELRDLSKLEAEEFWGFLDMRNWVYPYDADGHRHPFGALPRHVKDMADDPWRSLAGMVREAGGYAKSDMPYTEFMWADFLRRRVEPKSRDQALALDKKGMRRLAEVISLCESKAARHLPGWAGPDDIDPEA